MKAWLLSFSRDLLRRFKNQFFLIMWVLVLVVNKILSFFFNTKKKICLFSETHPCRLDEMSKFFARLLVCEWEQIKKCNVYQLHVNENRDQQTRREESSYWWSCLGVGIISRLARSRKTRSREKRERDETTSRRGGLATSMKISKCSSSLSVLIKIVASHVFIMHLKFQ